MCGASDVWCTGLKCCSSVVWVWLGWFVGGFDCAVVFVVLGDAGPLLLSPCNTYSQGVFQHYTRLCAAPSLEVKHAVIETAVQYKPTMEFPLLH